MYNLVPGFYKHCPKPHYMVIFEGELIFLDFCEEFFKKCLTNLLNDDNIVRLTCCKATQRRTLKTIQNKNNAKQRQ